MTTNEIKNAAMHEFINDKIDEWHKGNSNKQLHEYLGWSWEEYKLFVEKSVIPEKMLK